MAITSQNLHHNLKPPTTQPKRGCFNISKSSKQNVPNFRTTPIILQSCITGFKFLKTKHSLNTESYIDIFNAPFLLRYIVKFVFKQYLTFHVSLSDRSTPIYSWGSVINNLKRRHSVSNNKKEP